MFYFELEELKLKDSYQPTLQMIENISDEFQLSNYFGTISTAITELLDLLHQLTNSENPSVFISFIVENTDFYTHIELKGAHLSFPLLFREAASFKAIQTIKLLTDEVSFTKDGKGISIGFHVKHGVQPGETDKVKEQETKININQLKDNQ